MSTSFLRAALPGLLVSVALLAACADEKPTAPDTTTRMTVVVTVPSAPAGPAAMMAIPPSVASVALVVAEPDCGGTWLHADTLNVTGAEDSVAFELELSGPATACVYASAYSESDAQGIVVFEGSVANVDLSVPSGHVQVRIELGLVGIPAPEATTEAASDMTDRSAIFHASVTPGGFPTVAYFEWGLSTAYGSVTPVQVMGDGRDAVAVAQLVAGLDSEQTYHYRVVAINAGHVVYGDDAALVTLPPNQVELEFPALAPPSVTTDTSTDVGGSSALIAGTANPQGTNAWAYFEYGTDVTFGSTTAPQSIGGASIDVPLELPLGGLQEGTTYLFRLVAFNAGGLSIGNTRGFTTAGCTVGVEIPGNGLDDDCDGTPDEADEVCDVGLALGSTDPLDAVAALGLCRTAASAADWGVVSARWVLPDGSDVSSEIAATFATGHGLLDDFGPAVPMEGVAMLALSSGSARAPSDPGYVAPDPGNVKGYTTAAPPGVPSEPACPAPGTPNDAAGLEVVLRVPPNATSFSFRAKYFTADYPAWECTEFADRFWVLMDPAPAGATAGNVAYDANGNPITANNAAGLDETSSGLVGTGFDSFGGTQWLQPQVPVTPGSEITLRFVIYDSGDGRSDSLVLIDHFRWAAAD